MNDFKINYNKLENLKQINYCYFVYFIIFLIIILIIIACKIDAYHTETFYGIYDDDVLKIKTNIELSDKIKRSSKIIFNGKEVSYEIVSFSNYEVIDNKIYQEIDLKTDGYFYQNEVGNATIKFDKEKIIKHIMKLFK